MPFNLPCREFPENAPEGIEEGCDGGPKAAWAVGWNACLDEVKRRLDGFARKDKRMTAEYNLLVQENRALLAQLQEKAGDDADAQRARDKCIGAFGYDLGRLK